jgi:hypothetical protein
MKGDDFPFGVTGEQAANLLAQGELTHQEVADRVGIARSTLALWRKHPGFAARVEELRAEIGAEVRRIGVADYLMRVRALNDRWGRLRRIIDDRAADPTMAGVPGGTTGLLVRTTKAVGSGESMRIVEEFAVDTGLLKQLLDHEKQAARELGQWTEKTSARLEVAARPPIRIVHVVMPPGCEDAGQAG